MAAEHVAFWVLASGRRVVRGVLLHDDVVGMGLLEAGGADAPEPRVLLEFGDCARPEVAQREFQAAGVLVDHVGDGAPEGKHALDALGDEAGLGGFGGDAVAFAGALAVAHCVKRTHAPVDDVCASLVEDAFASVERYVPGIRSIVDYTCAATPLTFRRYTGHVQGATFGTKFEGLRFSQELPRQVPGLFHTGSVGIIMSGWLGAANYGVIVANEADRYLATLDA